MSKITKDPRVISKNKCPRCNVNFLYSDNVFNSTSKTHTGVKICNECGDDEGLTLAGFGDIEAKTRQVQWENCFQ